MLSVHWKASINVLQLWEIRVYLILILCIFVVNACFIFFLKDYWVWKKRLLKMLNTRMYRLIVFSTDQLEQRHACTRKVTGPITSLPANLSIGWCVCWRIASSYSVTWSWGGVVKCVTMYRQGYGQWFMYWEFMAKTSVCYLWKVCLLR